MQRARFWILCAIGGLLVISGILLFGAWYSAINVKSLKNMLPAEVDMRLDNLTLAESGDGNRSMTINAVSVQYFKTQDLFVLDTVRAVIRAEQGDYDIEADSGRYEQEKRVIELSGNIRVIDGDAGVLVCDELVLQFEEGLLTSDGEFCYSTPTGDLEGKSFVYRTKEKLLDIEGRAHLLF